MPFALAALLTVSMHASPARVDVVAWQVPPECPPVDALHAGIERSLGGLDGVRHTAVQVGVQIAALAGPRYRLALSLDAGDGWSERILTTDRCPDAVDTAAWLVAIAIDVRAGDPAAIPTTEPEPAIIPPPVVTPPDDPPAVLPEPPAPPSTSPNSTAPLADPIGDAEPGANSPIPAPPRSPLHLDLWAGGGLGLGVLPRIAPTAGLGLTLLGPRWAVELSGHYWATRRIPLGSQIGGRFTHGHAALRGCGAWERGRVRVPVCGGLAFGAVTGEGTGELTPRLARSLWIGALAGAGVRVRLVPRVGLLVHAEAVFGLRRPGFLLLPASEPAFRPAPVGFSAHIALVVRLR